MISHEKFSNLRLRSFCPQDDCYGEDLGDDAYYIEEGIRGIWFGRPVTRPDETFLIHLDLLDYSTDVGPAILERVGFPFTRHTTTEQVLDLLGRPSAARIDGPDKQQPHSDWYEFEIGGTDGYTVACIFLEPGAGDDWLPCYRVPVRSLWDVRIMRADLDTVIEDIEARCK